MKRIRSTKWFRLLQHRARDIARQVGQPYPGATIRDTAALHTEAEAQLGAPWRKMVEAGQ